MQLKEQLPFDVRQLMRLLPPDGGVRDLVRKFTLNPRVENRARSVKSFAEALGFTVMEVSLPSGVNGRLVQDAFAENGWCIEINESLSVQAKRFAVLHEMGHYFLHTNHEDPINDFAYFDLSGATFYVDATEEQEANAFAEAILFGNGQLAAAFSLWNGEIAKLAVYFGVTENVVRIAVTKLKV